MVRLALGCAVIVFCTMAGRAFAGGNARRAKLLAEMMDALQMLRVHMLDRLMPLGTALSRSQSHILNEMGTAVDKTGAAAAWSEIKSRELRRGGRLDCLSGRDIQVLDGLFEALGTTGRSEQKPVIDGAIKELGILEAEARSKSGEKSRLYTTLGALAGVAVVIGMI